MTTKIEDINKAVRELETSEYFILRAHCSLDNSVPTNALESSISRCCHEANRLLSVARSHLLKIQNEIKSGGLPFVLDDSGYVHIVISNPPIDRDSAEYFFCSLHIDGTEITLKLTNCPIRATIYSKEAAESQIQILRNLRFDAEMSDTLKQ